MEKFLLIFVIFATLMASGLASGPLIECRYMSALSYAEHSVFGKQKTLMTSTKYKKTSS